MTWRKAKIADLCTLVTSGGTPLSSIPSYYSPKEIPWLKTGEVNYCRIYDTESYISKEGLEKSSTKMIPANSVIVAMYGQGDTAGRVAINKIPLTTNQACCNLIINSKVADYEYVYYSLSILYDYLIALKNGGAQPNLNAKKIKEIEIPIPSLEEQHKIASILASYDNLIDNNQKQIKLLEEAAQRLYKEWFVDFRFPGHETTPIINGLPEGWKDVTIADVCETVGGGTPSTSHDEYYENGTIRWVTPTDLTKNKSIILLDTEKKITQKGLSSSAAKMLPPNTILMTSRASIGYFAVCEHEVCTNQGFISCIPKQEEMRYYLLFNLMNRVDEIKGKASGSTFLEIAKRTFRDMKICVPNEKLLHCFSLLISPIISKIRILEKGKTDLVNSRDRLLPKLMNGELLI